MKHSILHAFRAIFIWTALLGLLHAQPHGYTGMVSFGDSQSDHGNTVALFSEADARELTGYNANFFSPNRYSNGPVWTDHLYTNLGFGAIGTMARNNGIDVINGTNFSWAAARSGTGNSLGVIPNLQDQVGFYTAQLAASNLVLPDPSSTLFTLWAGGNDVFAYVEDNDPITPAQVVANVSTAVTNLYNAGGRSFLVPNLPPIGLSPDYLNDPIKGPQATAFVNDLNLQFDLALDALSGMLPGIDIIKLDINQLLGDVIADPAAYGLTNVTERAYTPFSGGVPPHPYGSVVANPAEYFYWDTAHVTSAMHLLIANSVVVPAIPEPSSSVLLLGSAVAALCFTRKRSRNTPAMH